VRFHILIAGRVVQFHDCERLLWRPCPDFSPSLALRSEKPVPGGWGGMSTEARSFADLVRAECGSSADLDAIREAFTRRFGLIVLSHFGKDVPCGVALTDLRAAAYEDVAPPARPPGPAWTGRLRRWLAVPRGERRRLRRERRLSADEQAKPVRLHLVFPPLTPGNAQVVRDLSGCEKQAVYAGRFLQNEDLRQCLSLLYWPAAALIELAGTAAPDPPGTAAPPAAPGQGSGAAQVSDVITEQMGTADQYYQYFTQRSVRLQYFRGIGLGMLALSALCILLYVFRTRLGVPVPFVLSVAAGAGGALTSVLSSATFGRIALDRPAGGAWNTMLGTFRPLIGSLFGVAFFALVSANFLPVKIPSGGGKVALYASIAFLAGFSQRWAQDTLKAAEGRVPAPPTPAEGQSAPGAAARPAQQKSVS